MITKEIVSQKLAKLSGRSFSFFLSLITVNYRLAEAAVKQREAGAKDILNETKQMLEDLGPPPPEEEEDAMNDEDGNEEDWETDDEMNE